MIDSGDDLEPEEVTTVDDEKFDLIYPLTVRRLSAVFWTPVRIAAEAAKLLTETPGARVLDIGSGVGKFCLLGASLTDGQFTGVEQRANLVEAARNAAAQLHLSDIEFRHANIVDVRYDDFDAFYIFNPFEENMLIGHKIDSAVPFSPELFKAYTSHVAEQLATRPLGTKTVTYMGYGDEIPACYTCELALFGDDLKLWIKTREHDPDVECLPSRPSRSYRGSAGWSPPRSHG